MEYVNGEKHGMCMVLGLRGDAAGIPGKIDAIINTDEVIKDGDLIIADIFGVKKLTKLRQKRNWWYLNFSDAPHDGIKFSKSDLRLGKVKLLGRVVVTFTHNMSPSIS
ncbi:hypothetical protein [Acetomicrobium sp.]|uniref:hypothetical protein n=1 Tax=Acetomicrobium sp. TaxID=1872099 RepID=UPI002B263B29|nr:hypothetical protein [Acetomicrobium sp.]